MAIIYELFRLMDIFYELFEVLKPYKEIAQFGFNIETLFFLITGILSILSTFALAAQVHKIKLHKSGEAISFIFYAFYILPIFAVGIYGYYIMTLALIINALCIGPAGLLVIFNLLKYEPYSRREKIIGFSASVSLPLIILVPVSWREVTFLVFGIIVLIMMQRQIYTFWKKKDSGLIHPGNAITGILSSLTWFIYAILMNIWPMIVFDALAALSWALVLLMYFIYKKSNKINNNNQ